MRSPTLAQAGRTFLEAPELGGRSKATLRLYEYNLRGFENWLGANDGPLNVEEIGASHVRGFLLHLARRPKKPGHGYHIAPKGGLSPETLRSYFKTLSSFFGWCEREGLLNGRTPMRNVEKPKPDHKEMAVLSDEEMKRFLKLLEKPSPQKRTLYVAFSLMWRLGLRVGEVTNLRIRDLNLKIGSLLVRGKGRKQRRLPVRNGLEDILEDYLENVRPGFDKRLSDALLLSWTGRGLQRGSLRKSFKLYADRAGIEGTPHTLRHSFATKAAREGINAFYLQRLLGHSSVRTTQIYFHSRFEDLEREIDKLQF